VIGDAYDRVAAEYAAKFAGDLDGLPLDRELLDSIWRQAPGGGPVLDIGCGPAQAGAYLAARGARVLGMDIAPGMLAAASGRQAGLRRAGLLGLVAGDMRALPRTRARGSSRPRTRRSRAPAMPVLSSGRPWQRRPSWLVRSGGVIRCRMKCSQRGSTSRPSPAATLSTATTVAG
jgi:SAM-dependent methyltransferase